MSSSDHRATQALLDAASNDCAGHGVQLTPLRREVLGLVLTADGPVTAYQLLDRLKQTRKGAAPPTVYRALDFLLEQGLVHKLTRLNAFIPCAESGHHRHAVQFLICRTCGTVVEIEDIAVASALAHAAEREGFHAGYAVVELDGTCAACRQSCCASQPGGEPEPDAAGPDPGQPQRHRRDRVRRQGAADQTPK